MPSVFNNMQIWSFTPANRWQGQTSQQMDSPNPTFKGGVARLNFKSTFPNVSMHPSTRDGGADLEKPAFHSSVFYGEREAIRADTGARSPGILWTLEVWGRRVKKKNARRTSFDLPIFLTKSNLKRRFQLGGKKKFPLLIISTFPTSTILMWCVWSCNLVFVAILKSTSVNVAEAAQQENFPISLNWSENEALFTVLLRCQWPWDGRRFAMNPRTTLLPYNKFASYSTKWAQIAPRSVHTKAGSDSTPIFGIYTRECMLAK